MSFYCRSDWGFLNGHSGLLAHVVPSPNIVLLSFRLGFFKRSQRSASDVIPSSERRSTGFLNGLAAIQRYGMEKMFCRIPYVCYEGECVYVCYQGVVYVHVL